MVLFQFDLFFCEQETWKFNTEKKESESMIWECLMHFLSNTPTKTSFNSINKEIIYQEIEIKWKRCQTNLKYNQIQQSI